MSFFVQPLVGRTILPYFGGTSAVWVTCLVAFQLLLLAGYGYAFLPAAATSVRRHTHLLLLAAIAVFTVCVPFFKNTLLSSLTGFSPVLGVVLAVLAVSGLLSLALSSNSTVVQSWVGGGRDVYHLYSISNVGSFAGLLCYPLLVEPFVPLTFQWRILGLGVLAYTALLLRVSDGVSALSCESSDTETATEGVSVRAGVLSWLTLPAISCGLMTAVTTHLTTDFAPLPLLWAVLLAIFLLSYVIGFSRRGECLLEVWSGLSIPVLLFAAWAIFPKSDNILRFGSNLIAALLLLLIVCSAIHAGLCRSRPNPARLPIYYFCTALGGAFGGVFAGVIAPLVFETVMEFPVSLVLASGVIALQVRDWRLEAKFDGLRKIAYGGLVVAVMLTILAARTCDRDGGQERLWRERGFYGVVSVRKDHVVYANGDRKDIHAFYHGKTVHGTQLPDTPLCEKPTLYYSLNGGGIAFESYAPCRAGKNVRVGFVGMGVGTLAVYGKSGDCFRFYEISPEAIHAATNTNLFTFLSASKAKVEIVEGDARLELEKDRAAGMEKFDLLFVDAYSGDSVPTHLITCEAFDLYKSMLKTDGILALHLSNWHMDLWPIIKAAARHLEMTPVGSYSGPVIGEFAEATGWAFLSTSVFIPRMPTCCRRVQWDAIPDQKLLTDECGSLLQNIRFGYLPPLED